MYKIVSAALLIVMVAFTSPVWAQNFTFDVKETNANSSFRGLSIVNDSLAWVSGTNGYVGKSTNSGKDWTFNQVKGFEKKDFRTLYAFDENTALIANAGAPACILYTDNGGKNWTTVYTDRDTTAFFDGIDFWNDKEGMIYGDPQHGRMKILCTKDGGLNWLELAGPAVEKGEASFAASGTGIRCSKTSKVIISTGGTVSRLFLSPDKGSTWTSIATPVIQGKSSTGIFSFDFKDSSSGVIVGGDYLADSARVNHVFVTKNGGKNWYSPVIPTRGYRECVSFITDRILFATGPTGTDISYDNGFHWKSLSDEKGFHVIKKARKGILVIAAGAKGKIAIIK